MDSKKSKQYIFDDPKNIKLVVRALVTVCSILVGLDLVLHRHASHPLEEIFAFYAIYGFVSCVFLVLLAKEIRKLVMRDERYYGDEPDGPEQGKLQEKSAEKSND